MSAISLGVWAFGESWKAELSGVPDKDIHSAPAQKKDTCGANVGVRK